MLSEKYQGEQKELDEKIRQLHEVIESATQTVALALYTGIDFFAAFSGVLLILSLYRKMRVKK